MATSMETRETFMTRTNTGPRTAAWEKKWKDLEADLQDAVSKLPESPPAMPTVVGHTDVRVQNQESERIQDHEELFALQSLTRFVATDLPLARSRQYTPRTLPSHAEPLTVGAHQDISESESTVHSKASDSETDSTTSVDEMLSQPAAPQQSDKETNEELDCQTSVLETLNVKVDMKSYWQSDGLAECLSSRPSAASDIACSHFDALEKKPKLLPLERKTSNMIRQNHPSKGSGQNRWNRLRFVRHLWLALVSASFAELCLISSGVLVDYFWSPCRTELDTCRHLHEMDCLGWSCQESSPLWASAWPAAGLVFLAMPMKCFLRSSLNDIQCRKALPLLITSFAVALLGVVGVGAIVLVESATAALHYADRCPMRRESSRCTANLCPSPPCRRESDFSPCLCGPLGEAELARALFLQGTPACQPYEWYTWQMKVLEELILQYEQFACVAGPLTCAATAVGGVLLFIQLMCCPLVLIGQWGGQAAICVLLGHFESETCTSSVAGVSRQDLQLGKAVGDMHSNSSTSLILNSEEGKSGDEGSGASEKDDTGQGNFTHRRTWDGDVSPELGR